MLMRLREQGLRTRVMLLEDGIREYLRGRWGRDRLERLIGDDGE